MNRFEQRAQQGERRGNRFSLRRRVEARTRDTKLDLESPDFSSALQYIDNFRHATTRVQVHDDLKTGAIGLGENPFLVPNTERFSMQFYWDSYFMMQPLLQNAEGRDLAKSIIGNFTTLLDRFGMIPNASAYQYIMSSQAPLLSSMVMDTYEHMTPEEQQKHTQWFEAAIGYAKYEYANVWTNESDYKADGIGSYHHRVEGYGLSRYGDRDAGYSLNAERESGWDFTSRFSDRAKEYLPIDLNSFLFKYEMDFAKAAEMQGNTAERDMWVEKANSRREEINRLMWNEQKGYYFDYIFPERRQDTFYSLAPFAALWTGVATPEQAKRMLEHLPKFDQGSGLMVTEKESSQGKIPQWAFHMIGVGRRNINRIEYTLYGREHSKQWDYPHVWPPIEFMAVQGMLRYSQDKRLSSSDRQRFKQTAQRLMEDYLRTTIAIFKEEGTFPEKFNGVTGKAGNGFHYDKQSGFGWTNAVFEEFYRMLKETYAQDAQLQQDIPSRQYATIAS